MSKVYKVKSGDMLRDIARRKLGDTGRWQEIVTVNPQLVGRGKASDGSPLIFPGDVLILPEDKSRQPTTHVSSAKKVVLDEGAAEDLTLFVDGKKFTGFTAYTISMPVDAFDSFSFTSIWDSGKKELRDLFRPFGYKGCEVYYNNDLLFRGVILPTAPSVSADSQTISVQGYPLCGVLADSDLPDSLYPPEFDGMNLKEIAEKVCKPFGLQVSCDVDVGAAFDKVEVDVSESVFDFLRKLAEQRGVFLSNTKDGSLLIWKPEKESVSANFAEGELPFVSCAPSFDEQNMFSHVSGFSKTREDEDADKYTYENKLLTKQGVLRVYNEVIEDADAASLEKATKALAGRMFASSVRYNLKIAGHKDKSGKLYRKNMMVSLVSQGAYVLGETKLQVDKAALKRSDNEGVVTELSLVLPGARFGELPEVYPWQE